MVSPSTQFYLESDSFGIKSADSSVSACSMSLLLSSASSLRKSAVVGRLLYILLTFNKKIKKRAKMSRVVNRSVHLTLNFKNMDLVAE